MAPDFTAPSRHYLRGAKLLAALIGMAFLGPMAMLAVMFSLAGLTPSMPTGEVWSAIALSLGFLALGGGGIVGLIAMTLKELFPAAVRKSSRTRRFLRFSLAWGVLASAIVGLLFVFIAIDNAMSEFPSDPGTLVLALIAAGLFLLCGLGVHSWRQLASRDVR